MILLDVVPPAFESPIAISIGIGFFLVFAAIAFIAFKMLKRTLKMAMRMTIAAVILLVAVIGSIILFFGIGSTYNNHKYPPRQSTNSSR